MKKLRLLKVEIWWQLEGFGGWLWDTLAQERVAYWLDFLPAYLYTKRKEAEHAYVEHYQENIYGELLKDMEI